MRFRYSRGLESEGEHSPVVISLTLASLKGEFQVGSTELDDEIRNKLKMLASGVLAPGRAADWAMATISSDRDELAIPRIWNALDQLAGADLMTAPGALMHGPADFTAWLEEYQECDEST